MNSVAQNGSSCFRSLLSFIKALILASDRPASTGYRQLEASCVPESYRQPEASCIPQSYPGRLYNTVAISCIIKALSLAFDRPTGCTTLLRGSLVLLRRLGVCWDFVPRWITCKSTAFGNFGWAGVLRPTGILALLPSALPCKGAQRD